MICLLSAAVRSAASVAGEGGKGEEDHLRPGHLTQLHTRASHPRSVVRWGGGGGYLKGQCQEIFYPRFSHDSNPSWFFSCAEVFHI